MKFPPPPKIGKRKRDEETSGQKSTSIQIITGSYERALHGIVATLDQGPAPSETSTTATFSNNFLINAHASSVRCLAISPPSKATPDKPSNRILATGGADERINLYQIASAAPSPASKTGALIASHNRELGSLLHHASTVTTLSFVSRKKLLSASLDNKIAISRVRDWTLLFEIRAPVPKAQGRPSGDTAGPGEVPAGINDVGIHPSAMLCLSVGQGERCMRLWNLVRGTKERVLAFDRAVLAALGESRWRGGEARSVVWSPDGLEFAVGFERGAVIYDLECVVRGVVKVEGTKVCRSKYLPRDEQTATTETTDGHILALSTEDGRILFYRTKAADTADASSAAAMERASKGIPKASKVPVSPLVARIGEKKRGSRIKDFVILPDATTPGRLYIVTGSSEGEVKLWSVDCKELADGTSVVDGNMVVNGGIDETNTAGVGALLGETQTGKRITCLDAFVMEDAAAAAVTSRRSKATKATDDESDA